MSEEQTTAKKRFSTDWLLRGVLTKIGDTFDRVTGRGYRPSSSLATSELAEKLKKLLDHELRDGKFVPHNITLKMQWDKFSADSDDSLKRLEDELKVAVIDHINDRRYHTYAPIALRVKPDYFTEGVKLFVSFDKFDKEDHEVAVNVTVPQIKVGDYVPDIELPSAEPEPSVRQYIARFTAAGKQRERQLEFVDRKRVSVGRGGENELVIDDASVSKMHASLVVNAEGKLTVADTGSTNGTFVGGARIAYGKAVAAADDQMIKFGSIEVRFEDVTPEPEPEPEVVESIADAPTEAFTVPPIMAPAEPPVTRIEVLKKIEAPTGSPDATSPTIPARPIPVPAATSPAVSAPTTDTPEPTADRIVFDFENGEK